MQGFSARLDSRCIQACLYRDIDEPNAVCYVEDWSSTEALETEIRSDRFSSLLALMETAAEPPTLQFRLVDDLRGLDYVAEVRGEQARTTQGRPPQ